MPRLFAFALTTLLCVLPNANAGVMTQSVGIAGSLESPNSVSFRKFDAGLGALNGVELSLELFATSHFSAVSASQAPPFISFFELGSSASVGPYLDQVLEGRGLAVFAPGATPLGGLDPVGLGFGFVQGQGTAILSDSALLGDFISTGAGDTEVELPIGLGGLTSPNLKIQGIASMLTGRLTVDYLFDEIDQAQPASANDVVPEPASIAVLGIGALFMLRPNRRRRVRPRV